MKNFNKLILLLLLFPLFALGQTTIYTEQFGGTTAPSGWLVTNAGAGNNWTFATTNGYTGTGSTGTALMNYVYNVNEDANTWAFLQDIAFVTTKRYRIKFYQRCTSFPENLKITVGSGQTVAAQTTTLLDLNAVINGTYTLRTSDWFTPPSDANYNFAFNCYSTADQNVLRVDYVIVEEDVLPACSAPTGLSATGITGTSANVSWSAASPVPSNGYQWAVTTSATPPASGTPESGTSASAMGLSAGTAYYLHVRSDCGGSGNSSWSTITFTTTLDCSAATSLSPCGTVVTSGNLATTPSAYSLTGCGFSTPGKEKLYTFTAPTTGTYVLEITNVNGGSDYIEYFYKDATAGDCGSTGWTCIDDNFDIGTDNFGPLTAGVTYYILLDAEEVTGTANHTFKINCPVAAPANDLCAGAVTVMDGSSVTLNVSNATDDATAPTCDFISTATKGVWYVYTAPANAGREVTIAGCNTDYDTRVRVYTGNCTALVCVTGDDDDDCTGPGSGLAETTQFTVAPSPSAVDYYILITGGGNSLDFSISSVLPIELTAFTGKAMEQSNMLYWSTATEQNVQWHIVERSVSGTDNWTAVGQKNSRGNTISEQKYELEDKLILPKAYYRIHTIDFDGQEQFSKTISITRNDSRFGIIAAYPNPASDLLNIQFNTVEESIVHVQIIDMTGRLVFQQKIDAVKGTNSLPINVGQFSAGTYTLNVVNSNAVAEPIRFVKQ
jgi:Secretion system C-terminal sorting domain